MALFEGHYSQLIRWKIRYLLETGGTLSKIVAKTLENRVKNEEILSSCYNYNIDTDPKHSNFTATNKSCNCTLCVLTRDYVNKKLQLSRFQKSFYNEDSVGFYYGYLKSKAVNSENYTERDYFYEVQSTLNKEIQELRQQRRSVVAAIMQYKKL